MVLFRALRWLFMLGYGGAEKVIGPRERRWPATPSNRPAPQGQRDPLPRRTGVTGLDAGQFAPLSTSEANQTIADMGGLRSAYLDSLSDIPDERLPRIQIIDRTMVGAGLISAEELVEIHEIGQEYELLRGDRVAMARKANEAVVQDQAEREALKSQKKAEAAERQRLHAQQVAHRKATDIVFLGRGVSGGLSDRRCKVERLQGKGLEPLATPADLAKAMALTIPRLRFLAFHSDAPTLVHYISFPVAKKSGGQRLISAPHRDMKAVQNWALEQILSKLQVHSAAHGFVPTRSTVTNARPHVASDIVINVDLQDFFGTITWPRVRGLFQGVGYSPAVASILGLLCTEAPRRPVRHAGQIRHAAVGPRCLPQGAPSSPAISNLIARKLDQRLAGLADKLGWTYTRYADDITFSARLSKQPIAATQIGYILARLRHIAIDEGFALNESKTRVQRPSTRQSVTGLVVNHTLGVPRPLVRRLRSILHHAQKEGLEAQNREDHQNFEAWVGGMISYIEMVKPAQGQQLRAQLNRVR